MNEFNPTKVYNLQKILSDFDSYKDLIKSIEDFLKKDNFKERKKLKIKVVFPNSKRKVYLVHFCTILIFLRPWAQFGYKLEDDSAILDEEDINNLTNKVITNYFNKLIDLFIDDVKNTDLNDCIASIIEEAALISYQFNPKFGNTVSIRSLIDLSERNPDMDKIIHTKLKDNSSIYDNERLIKERTDECVEILKNEENCFKDYLNCGEGVNILQLTQYMINIGYKPDLEGNTQPIPINTNYLLGMRNVTDYYIDGTGGRKASIVNFKQVKRSGYLMRKLSLLCSNTVYAKDDNDDVVDDCGSENYVKILVDNESKLNLLTNIYFINDDGELEYITENHKELIGKTILIRSPITCRCKNGICKTCYGHLYNTNSNIHIGLLAVLLLTAIITQKMLSVKHLLTTKSEKIDWSEDFLKFFSVDTNTIMFNPEWCDSGYSLIIEKNSIDENDDFNNEGDENSDEEDSEEINDSKSYILKKNITRFKIKISNKKKIDIELPKSLYLSEDLQELYDKYTKEEFDEVEIPFKSFNLMEPLFYFIIENNELTKILNDIIDLIEKSDHLGLTTYEDVYNAFLNLLINSGIDVNATHIAIIIRELIRNKDNILMRPDDIGENNFDKDKYVLLRVTEANLKSPALSTSLAFEHLKKQILSVLTYKKDSSSIWDDIL